MTLSGRSRRKEHDFMIVRKAEQRVQVRDHVRGGPGTLENRHILEPDAMLGKCTLFTEFFFDPGDGIGPHPHGPDAEIYYVLEGALTVTENGAESLLHEGDSALCPPGCTHSVENRSDRPARMLAVILP
jgi:quercetin dioxygenase-like cupin family protein